MFDDFVAYINPQESSSQLSKNIRCTMMYQGRNHQPDFFEKVMDQADDGKLHFLGELKKVWKSLVMKKTSVLFISQFLECFLCVGESLLLRKTQTCSSAVNFGS